MCPRFKIVFFVLAFGWAAPLYPNALDDYINALREVAHPVEGESDLKPLLERIGERKLILLGEASHGTSEFYAWRSKISRRLIEENGISFVAVEGDWAALQDLNRWVTQPVAPEQDRRVSEILEDFDRWPSWLWANREIVEFAQWLRAYNKERPEDQRVGFFGIDVYGWEKSLDALLAKLESVDEDLHSELSSLYREFSRYRGDNARYARAAFAFATSAPEEVPRALKRLRENRDILVDALGEESYFFAEQHALVIQNAEAHIRKMPESGAASWNTRAAHFKKTVARLLEFRGAEARGIVWAHNTHVGDARGTPMPAQGQTNIGRLARDRWGDEVFILGFSTYQGGVVAGSAWESPRETMTVPPAQPKSLDYALHNTGHPQALFFLNDLPADHVLAQTVGQRAIGVVYNPAQEAGNYVPTRTPLRYDALLFISETHPLTPLH